MQKQKQQSVTKLSEYKRMNYYKEMKQKTEVLIVWFVIVSDPET